MRKVLFYLLTGAIFFFGLTPTVNAITLADLTMYQLEAEAANYYAYIETRKALDEGKLKTDCDTAIYYDQKVVEFLVQDNTVKDVNVAQKLQNLIDKVYRKQICNPGGTINIEGHKKFTLEMRNYLEKQIEKHFDQIKNYNDLINFVILKMYEFFKSKLSS